MRWYLASRMRPVATGVKLESACILHDLAIEYAIAGWPCSLGA